jgi:hypothetical protein
VPDRPGLRTRQIEPRGESVLEKTVDQLRVARELFRRDGRWGLVCLSAYAALAMLVDAVLFREPFMSRTNAYLSAELALPLLFLIVPAPRLKSTLTVAYLILVLWASVDLSPSSY